MDSNQYQKPRTFVKIAILVMPDHSVSVKSHKGFRSDDQGKLMIYF